MELVDTVPLEIPDSLSPHESLGASNWKSLTSFVPLLKVLPALSVQQNEYVVNGLVTKESWNQLRSFAKAVEGFYLSDAEGKLRVASLTYLRLAQFQGSLPLFPSLRHLQIVNATASLSHSFLLLSPSLEYLEISGFPPSHAHLIGSFLTTLSVEEGLSLKSLVLGPSPFDSESLRSIPCFKDLLSLKLNGAVSRWDSQLLVSIGTLPKLLELVVDAGDAEYHAVHSPPLPSDSVDDTKVDERSPVIGAFNSPRPTQAYPDLFDFPHRPPSNSFSDFGSGSQPSPISVSPLPAHQKDVHFNFDGFVAISHGDSRPKTPYTPRALSPVLLPAFQPTPECNVSDLAVASRPATPLQSTTAAIPDSPSPCSSALQLPSLEIAGFKTLRTLSFTGSLSLIHEILSSIATLDLDAVTLVIHLSQAKLCAPKPSRPPTPEPTYGKKKKKGKACSERLPRPPSLSPRQELLWADAPVRSDPPSIKDTAPITNDQLLALTSRIASQWANCIRVVDMKPFRSTTFFFSGPTDAIFSLTPCRVLEVLDFRGWSFGPSLNNTISDLAHSWPKLTSLYFSVDNITIPTLRTLALSCPLLNTLETNINLDDIPPINSTRGYALSHPLKVLSAGDNDTTIQNSQVLLLVARHLNILFPHVKVTTHERYNVEQWLQIGEFVEVFQAVRKDDADRGA